MIAGVVVTGAAVQDGRAREGGTMVDRDVVVRWVDAA